MTPDSQSPSDSLRRLGIGDDLQQFLSSRLSRQTFVSTTFDVVFQRLCRFFQANRSPSALILLLQRDVDSLDALIQLLASSAWLAECLIADPEAFDLLRMTGGQPIERAILVDEINSETESAGSIAAVQAILRRHRRRETLRIAYGDLIQHQPLEQTNEQLTFLADAILGAALEAARKAQSERRGEPTTEVQLPQLAGIAVGRFVQGNSITPTT